MSDSEEESVPSGVSATNTNDKKAQLFYMVRTSALFPSSSFSVSCRVARAQDEEDEEEEERLEEEEYEKAKRPRNQFIYEEAGI